MWSARGYEIAVADNDDPSALAQAFAGLEGAFVMFPHLRPGTRLSGSEGVIAALRASLLQAGRSAQRPRNPACSTSSGCSALRGSWKRRPRMLRHVKPVSFQAI
jgi:NAD(P)H dehydrogenase (quinone)